MKLTGEEIITKIKEEIDPYDFERITYKPSRGLGIDLGESEMVADETFTSGEAWRVIYFKDHDVYIRQNGYFDSYESVAVYDEHNYDTVIPYERMIIDYKKPEEE